MNHVEVMRAIQPLEVALRISKERNGVICRPAAADKLQRYIRRQLFRSRIGRAESRRQDRDLMPARLQSERKVPRVIFQSSRPVHWERPDEHADAQRLRFHLVLSPRNSITYR